jgi:tetratricopeptide (TPR) repeat protein/DNA-binding winged helix-turn-helix (wHTH) protein
MGELIRAGHLEIDLQAYRLMRDSKPVRLTRTEWALLGELVQHKNQVLSHRTLLQRVWGMEYGSESDYVHTYISRLRRKLEDNPAEPQYILTEPGVGYLFQREVSQRTISMPSLPKSDAIVINPFPLVVERYVGREREQADIQKYFAERIPVIGIYGRAGVGKTALACQVILTALKSGAYAGVVLLSAASTGISLSTILHDFERLLPSETAAPERIEPERQIAALFDRLGSGNYLLLLDNLETLQDRSTGALSSDLELFLKSALQQGGALRVLITSREPLALPRHLKVRERAIMLDQGLSVDESVALLQKCDPDNAAGLRDAPVSLLQKIATITNGYPRALEAAVGLLLEDAFLTPERLVQANTPLTGEVAALVESALERLDEPAQNLLTIAAAFQQAIPRDTLMRIAAEYLPGIDLHQALNRLVRAFFLKYNQQDDTLSLHPIDAESAYARLPQGTTGLSRGTLHSRIADDAVRRQTTPSQTPSAYQSEITHRLLSGDEMQAARLLLKFDAAYLTPVGAYNDLARQYQALLPRVTDAELRQSVLLRLGDAYRSSGRTLDAVRCYEQAQVLAQATPDPVDDGDVYNSLGWAYYDLGHFVKARDYWSQARTLYETASRDQGVADVYGGMGWVSYLLGQYDEAEGYFDQAIETYETLGDARGIAINRGDLGVVHIAQGDYAAAIHELEAALQLTDINQLMSEMSYKSAYLATAYLLNSDLPAAQRTLQLVIEQDEVLNLPVVLALYGVVLTRQGKSNEAIAVFQQAIERSNIILGLTDGLYRVIYARALAQAGLALLQGKSLEETTAEYEHAVAVCSADGVIQANRELLQALMQSKNGAALSPVLDVLKA